MKGMGEARIAKTKLAMTGPTRDHKPAERTTMWITIKNNWKFFIR